MKCEKLTAEQQMQLNANILEQLGRDNVKQAQEAAGTMIRTQIREGAFVYQFLPFERATDSMLQKSVENQLAVIVWEKEPDSPGSMWVPLQAVPESEYMTGSDFYIPMSKQQTKRFIVDTDDLRTRKTDLRKIFSENSIKDSEAALDGKFIEAVNTIVTDTGTINPLTGAVTATGAVGDAQVVTGKVQWKAYGSFTRGNFADAMTMLHKGSNFPGMKSKFRLRNAACLMNETTAMKFFLAMDRIEAGGDLSQKLLENGLVIDKFMGLKLCFTIKDDIVPDGTVYFFAAPEFLGKAFYITDWTTYMKKEGTIVEFYSYWYGGFAIANLAAVARADFTL